MALGLHRFDVACHETRRDPICLLLASIPLTITTPENYPMKTRNYPALFLLLLPLACSLDLQAADAQPGPAGHWEGAIAVSPAALNVRVDLSRSGESWQGTIDIPVQGLRGFKLDPVKVDGATVMFAMPGIPGDPRFVGQLAGDANGIAGKFSQGGGESEFKLERKAPPAPVVEPAVVAIPGKGLEGNWQGTLKPAPGIELRLAMEIASAKAEKPDGVLISIDQGGARIPITALTEKDGGVHVETLSIGGAFDGKLNPDGSEMAGEWKQRGGPLPLVFKRVAKAVSATPSNHPQ